MMSFLTRYIGMPSSIGVNLGLLMTDAYVPIYQVAFSGHVRAESQSGGASMQYYLKRLSHIDQVNYKLT